MQALRSVAASVGAVVVGARAGWRAPAGPLRGVWLATLTGLVLLAAPAAVLAHGGPVPDEPPTLLGILTTWRFEPTVWLPVVALALLWRTAVRRVNAAHPANPVPGWRTWAFVAGLAALLLALDSGIERYDTTLFSVHMVQHILLTLVAPPLLLVAAPVTLLLRVVSPETRRSVVLPILHSRVVRVVSHPVVAWVVFAGVMWASHFTPLFDAALEDELIHRIEHGLFLVAALLFWWPAVAADPAPRRLAFPVRLVYVGLQMPQNTFLAVAITMANAPLYAHYATVERSWGPTPLADQQMAGGLMWVGGDLLFLAAVFVLIAAWFRAEERDQPAADRRVEAERTAIREREARLAARHAGERAGE